MIHTTLDCVRPVSLDIWRVERCVCVWSSWLSTSSSTAVTFTAVRAFYGLPLSCRWSVHLVSNSFFSKVYSHSFFQFFYENSASILCEPYFLKWCKFLFNALPLALNRLACYITSILSLYQQLLFTIIAFGFVYRHPNIYVKQFK